MKHFLFVIELNSTEYLPTSHITWDSIRQDRIKFIRTEQHTGNNLNQRIQDNQSPQANNKYLQYNFYYNIHRCVTNNTIISNTNYEAEQYFSRY